MHAAQRRPPLAASAPSHPELPPNHPLPTTHKPLISPAWQFFISGLTLRTDEMRSALTRRNALGTGWGLLSIMGVTPLLAFAVRGLPLQPPEYATGLTIFCIVPTTVRPRPLPGRSCSRGRGASGCAAAAARVPAPSAPGPQRPAPATQP